MPENDRTWAAKLSCEIAWKKVTAICAKAISGEGAERLHYCSWRRFSSCAILRYYYIMYATHSCAAERDRRKIRINTALCTDAKLGRDEQDEGFFQGLLILLDPDLGDDAPLCCRFGRQTTDQQFIFLLAANAMAIHRKSTPISNGH